MEDITMAEVDAAQAEARGLEVRYALQELLAEGEIEEDSHALLSAYLFEGAEPTDELRALQSALRRRGELLRQIAGGRSLRPARLDVGAAQPVGPRVAR